MRNQVRKDLWTMFWTNSLLQLWSAVEKEINLTECDIFSFNPDKDPNDDDEVKYYFQQK